MVLGNLVVVLNPLGRFDSYWVLSDALGIVDLSQQRTVMLRKTFHRNPAAPKPDDVTTNGVRKYIVMGYSFATTLMIGWFGYVLVRAGGPLISQLASASALVLGSGAHGQFRAALYGVMNAAPGLLMVGLTVYRLVRMLWRPLSKIPATLKAVMKHAAASRA
jgi:hypothetical protein